MRITPSRRKTVYLFVLLLLLTLAFYALPGTLGSYIHTFYRSDSANTAKFNVVITAPDELSELGTDNSYHYYFPADDTTKTLDFTAGNFGETTVICTPHINNGISYRIFVSGELQNDFVIPIGESVDFQLVILAAQLDAEIKEASFFIDIEQLGG